MTQENRDGGQKERKTSQRPSCHKNEGEGDERISQKAGYAIFASVLKTVYAIFFSLLAAREVGEELLKNSEAVRRRRIFVKNDYH